MPDLVKVLIFSAASYIYLFIIAKILGKKQIAQLTFVDYVVGISIGSIAAEMATETTEPIYHYLIAMTIFFLLDLTETLLSRRSANLKKLLSGKPLVLINDGKFDYEAIKTCKISVDEFVGMARDKGYFDVNDIAFAIFEKSGKLSILPKSHSKPLVAKDMGLNPPKPKLVEFLVVDGRISKDSLKNSGHDKQWLLEGLKIQDEKDLKNILIAYYDEDNQNFNVHYKNEYGAA